MRSPIGRGEKLRYWLEKKTQNFMTLLLLVKYMKTYRNGSVDSSYWEKKQRKEIKKFVRYIYKIPFYRNRFDQAGIQPADIVCGEDFLRLPPLTKDEYRRWMNEEYEKHPEKYKHWIKNYSSGSTGTPMVILQRHGDNCTDIANFFRGVLIQNRNYRLFSDRTFKITYKDIRKKDGDSILQRLGVMERRTFPGATKPEELVKEFNTFKPDIYHGLHSPLLAMVQYAEEAGVKMHRPKLVCTMGERLDDPTLHTFNRHFPGAVYNLYGSTESGGMAVSVCNEPQEEEKRRHIIWHDTHVFNVVDENNQPASKGRLLITPMGHKGFPMVNYDIGDFIETYHVDGVKKIKHIIGRENDLIHNKDGSYYTHSSVNRILSGVSGVNQFRVVQENYDHLNFFIVAENEIGKEQIEKGIRERALVEFYKGEKNISVIFQDSLDIDKAAKRRLLISKVVPGITMEKKN